MSRPHTIRWTALACLLALLLGVGCGSDDAPRPVTGESRFSEAVDADASPDAAAVSPAPGETAGPTPTPERRSSPDPARTPLPRGTPKPLDDDPVAVVRGLLEAVDAEDYPTQRFYATRAAGALLTIRDVIAQENHRRGADTDNRVTYESQPSAGSTSDTEATVSVSARVMSIVSGDRGKVESEDTIDGPVRLRRDGDRWRVADFVYSGGALESGYHAVDAKQSREGFTLTVGAILSYKKTTATLVRIVNEDGGRVPLQIEPAALVASDGAERKQTQYAFESSVTPTGFLGFERVEGKPASLRVPVSRGDNDKRWTFEITF